MKKLATLTFTAALALAATAATATTASAHGWDRGYGPAVGAGVGFGLELDFHMRLGAFAGVGAWDGYHTGYVRHGRAWRAHVEYCSARYRSYNPATDTYTGYDRRQHLCR